MLLHSVDPPPLLLLQSAVPTTFRFQVIIVFTHTLPGISMNLKICVIPSVDCRVYRRRV